MSRGQNESQIVETITEIICDRIAKQTIAACQKTKKSLLSG